MRIQMIIKTNGKFCQTKTYKCKIFIYTIFRTGHGALPLNHINKNEKRKKCEQMLFHITKCIKGRKFSRRSIRQEQSASLLIFLHQVYLLQTF